MLCYDLVIKYAREFVVRCLLNADKNLIRQTNEHVLFEIKYQQWKFIEIYFIQILLFCMVDTGAIELYMEFE